MFSRLAKFWRLSWPDRCLTLEALIWLGLARLAILALPFRWIAPYMGQPRAVSPIDDASVNVDQVKRIARAIRRTSRHTPWDSNCLSQALTAKRMLHRRRINCTLYLGLAKDDDDHLQAHAWVRSGSFILTGGRGSGRYAAVATFAEGNEP
jgi:transglutaminase superfamily protein